ncbi:MAG: hypothetical protein L0Y70_28300, partial [Gemmataceae bacterium]|nr:hypothetical protein [Gemmataceae bacterium]
PADRYQTPLELLYALQDRADFRAYLARTSRLGSLASFELSNEAKKTDEAVVPQQVAQAIRPAQAVREDHEPRPKRKRFRDDEEDDQPRKKKTAVARWPAWWPAAAVAGVVFLGITGWLAFGRGGAPSNERKKIDEQPPVVPVAVKKEDPSLEVPPEGIVGPPLPDLPKLANGEGATDIAALRKEFLGPFAAAPAVPEKAQVVRVSRLAAPGPDSFRSVAEALAGTRGDVVVQIHDQGPLHEATLPPVSGRSVILQGGDGLRPLLVWDITASALPEKAPAHFLSLSDGDLHLDNLDLVLQWPDSRAQQAAAWFALQGGSLTARSCTVSVAGKNARGISFTEFKPSLANDRGSEFNPQKPPAASPTMLRCRLSRCFVRGADLVVLTADAVPLDILIDESLLVTGDPAMIQLRGGEPEQTILRVMRSTLVTGQHVLRWQLGNAKTGAPRILAMAWDTILARANPAAPRGDMLLLEGSLANMNWRPVQCIYAGWKRLIHAADRSIDSGTLSAWRAHWSIADGDLDLSESWPGPLRAHLETLSPGLFDPAETPAAFAATSGAGWVGCSLGRLPSEPEAWRERTYERYALLAPPLPEAAEAPPIADLGDGYYHGERIDVTKLDLGQYLTARLPSVKAAPKVVLHLAGKGQCVTSPIKVKDLPQLVLYFEPVADKEEPLTLVANPRSVNDRAPLIEIDNGSLELIQARIVLENRKVAAIPSQLLKITGGDLILNRCVLQGSLDKGPGTYQGLIRWEAGLADYIPTLVLKDSVLVSARSLLEMRGPCPRVRLRNNVLLGWDQGLVFAPHHADRQTRFVLLENNTFACRKAALAFAFATPDAPQVVVQAQGNFFVDCFAEEGRPARLLAIPPADLARGLVLWQGKGNAFDSRFTRWLDGDGVAKASPIVEWKKVWGSAGELSARLLDPAKAVKTFSLEPPTWSHLALPAGFGAGAPPYGADLVRLGLLKKKGN